MPMVTDQDFIFDVDNNEGPYDNYGKPLGIQRRGNVSESDILEIFGLFAVTVNGLESIDPGRYYAIDKEELTHDGGDYCLLQHMVGKNWVVIDDFYKALIAAIKYHYPDKDFTAKQILLYQKSWEGIKSQEKVEEKIKKLRSISDHLFNSRDVPIPPDGVMGPRVWGKNWFNRFIWERHFYTLKDLARKGFFQ
jgi:hypothetical protein